MKKNKYILIVLAALLTFTAAGCGSTSSTQEPKEETNDNGEDVTKVLIGIRQDLFPTSYIDEKGEPSGYDIEIARKIDELLPQYEFEYEAVSQEALLTGLQTGKYAAAVAGFYDSDERRASYLFPQEPIGGNIIGVAVRNEDADKIYDWESIYDNGAKLIPQAPSGGIYGLLIEYNNEHPDKAIPFTETDWTDSSTAYNYVAGGDYDVYVTSKNVFDETVKALGRDDLTFNAFTAIKTWSLFNPAEQELAGAYDEALRQLKEDGVITELSIEYFGEDILPFIEDAE